MLGPYGHSHDRHEYDHTNYHYLIPVNSEVSWGRFDGAGVVVKSLVADARPQNVLALIGPARKAIQQGTASRLQVNRDKTHIEHNTSPVALIADMRADMDFRREGPEPDLLALHGLPLESAPYRHRTQQQR